MNKILVNNEEQEHILNDGKYEFRKNANITLEINNLEKIICLTVLDNIQVVLNVLGKHASAHFHIKVGKNASFTLNYLLLEGNTNISVDLEKEYASFQLNYSILGSQHSKNQILVRHNAPQTKAFLKNHGFSRRNANLILDVSAYIPSASNKCVSKQDNQIIEEENSISQINPNLYIDNYDVEASHSAYVGEFKENELFYLMSRGLTEEASKFLLLKSFLIGSFSIDEKIKEKYYDEIIKYFDKEV